MLRTHANIIKSHLTELSEKTNLNALVPRLISNKVFTQEMVERIWASTNSTDPKLQSLSLYLNIEQRGPHAFLSLVRALTQSGHEELAQKLLHADSVYTEDSLPPSPPTEDSPDSSPTHHHCRILQSANPFQLPGYLDQGLRDAFRTYGETNQDDMVHFCDQSPSRPVNIQHGEVMHLSDGTLPDKYRMTSKPRGHALIINNVVFEDEEDYPTRNGAYNDDRDMKDLLQQFYFKVDAYRNLTKQEMVRRVESFANNKDWLTVDCAFVVLMSHGKEGESEEDTEIVGTDGIGFKTRDILSYFYNDSCQKLRNKPKIFIFQSCRGALTDRGVEVDLFGLHNQPYPHRTETDGRARPRTVRDRSRSDIFVAHPVPPGIKANRDRISGAWFIQTIVNVFSKHAHCNDLEDLFKLVDREIKLMINLGDTNYQTVTTRTIGWNKKFYFNPGLSFQHGQVVRDRPLANDTGMDVVDTPAESQNGVLRGKKGDLKRLTEDDDEETTSGCFRCRPS